MASKFSFLESKYPELFKIIELSEQLIHVDSSSSLTKSRLFSEKLIHLIWQFEALDTFEGNQVERINQLFFKNRIPDIVKDFFHTIRISGNKATHDGNSTKQEALFVLKKCFQLAKWFYETYENDYLENVIYELPENANDKTIETLTAELEKVSKENINYKAKIDALNVTPEVVNLRKERSVKIANNMQLDERDTREMFIDKQLREAGWECDTNIINYKKNKTLPKKGKNLAIAEWPCGPKWADYALFIGTKLYGFVEAKKYASDISTDLHQSKIYANMAMPIKG